MILIIERAAQTAARLQASLLDAVGERVAVAVVDSLGAARAHWRLESPRVLIMPIEVPVAGGEGLQSVDCVQLLHLLKRTLPHCSTVVWSEQERPDSHEFLQAGARQMLVRPSHPREYRQFASEVCRWLDLEPLSKVRRPTLAGS